MQHHNATSFSPFFTLFNHFHDKYFKGHFGWGNFENDLFDHFAIIENSTSPAGDFTSLCFLISELKGELDMTGENAVYTPSEENLVVRLIIDNENYTATLLPSGKYKKQNIGKIKNHIRSGESCDVNTNEYIIEMPEKLTIQLKKGTADYLTIELTTDADFSETGIDYANDSCSVTAKLTLPNNYTMNIHPAEIDMKTHKAKLSFDLFQDQKNILAVQADGDVKFELGDVDAGCNQNHVFTGFIFDYARNLVINADILGEVQLKSTIKDLDSWFNLKECKNGEEPEAAERFNEETDIAVYYDHNNLRQAEMELETFKSNPDQTAFEYRPLLIFNDGSRFLINEFWSEDELQEFIDFGQAFVDLFQSVADNFVN